MRSNRALKYSIWFGVVGLLIISLVFYVERETLSTYQKNLPYLKLGDNIKNRTTKAHLWFEELMSGDDGIDFEEDVMKYFQDSRNILESVYDGKATELGTFPKPDEETKGLLKLAIIELEDLINITHLRWDNRGSEDMSESAGGSLDEKFDVTYERVQQNMDDLMAHFDTTVQADSQYLEVLSWLSIVLVSGVFGILTVMVYRLQRKSDITTGESNKKLQEETTRMAMLSDFVEAVSKGDYNVKLDANAEDDLSGRLVAMRDTLRENAENDKRANWATSGLAKIGDILRRSSGSKSKLYDDIIKFVVEYTKSNQGGLFVISDDEEQVDRYLELVSCFAFERKKFLTKRVETGQGLVGQCFVEGLRIHLLEIPEDYVNITSGLGGTTPRAVLLVPMKVNDEVYGVIELASFRKFEEYEIDLVEQFADTIASTISSVRANESTRLLLERT